MKTSYAVSIKPYKNKKKGRDTVLALVTQYSGEDK